MRISDWSPDVCSSDLVGTTFYNQSIESRLELVQAKRGGWDGAIGAQFFARNFHVVGEEKFLPRNETEQLGFFTLQSFDLGTTRVELGGRYEHTRVGADAAETLLNPAYRRSFDRSEEHTSELQSLMR